MTVWTATNATDPPPTDLLIVWGVNAATTGRDPHPHVTRVAALAATIHRTRLAMPTAAIGVSLPTAPVDPDTGQRYRPSMTTSSGPSRPPKSTASKSELVDYATTVGVDRNQAEQMTKDDLNTHLDQITADASPSTPGQPGPTPTPGTPGTPGNPGQPQS